MSGVRTFEPEELRPPLIAGVGVFIGASMLALSVTGLLWRIDALAFGLCFLAAALASGLWLRRSGARPGIPLWFVVLLVPLLVIPALASLSPPTGWDEVAYGAALPRDYARAGRFFYNDDYGPYSAFPGNYQALVTASLVIFGDVIPARFFNVLLAFGLAVVAVHISRRLGTSRPVALITAVLVLSATSLLAVVPMIKNDVANGFFQSLTLLALAGYAARREPSRLALGAFFLGTAVGIKYSSLLFALSVTPLMVVLVLRGAVSRGERLRGLALFGGVALAAALPWYARNAAVFGNPFFPFLNELLGAENNFTAEHSALTREMFEGLAGYTWSTGTVGVLLKRVGSGFGWVPVLLSVPGLVAVMLRRRDTVSVFLGAAFVSFGLVVFFAGHWQPRYFLSLLVLSCAFAAAALEEIGRVTHLVPGRRRTAAVALGILTLTVGGDSIWTQWRARGERVRDNLWMDRQELVRSYVPFWRFADWANRNLAPDDKIAVGMGVQPFYYLDRPYFHIHPMTEKGNLQALQTPEEYLQAFRSLGITWLGFRRFRDGAKYSKARTPRRHAFLLRFFRARGALERSGKLTFVTRVGGVRVYRIEAPDAEKELP